jgi:hypothetical protein
MSAVDHWKRQANETLDLIDEKLLQYPLVQQVSAKVPARVSHLALGLVTFLSLFVLYGFGGRLVASLVGFAWPLYQSFHSLKNKPEPGKVDEEDTQWLSQWDAMHTNTETDASSRNHSQQQLTVPSCCSFPCVVSSLLGGVLLVHVGGIRYERAGDVDSSVPLGEDRLPSMGNASPDERSTVGLQDRH